MKNEKNKSPKAAPKKVTANKTEKESKSKAKE